MKPAVEVEPAIGAARYSGIEELRETLQMDTGWVLEPHGEQQCVERAFEVYRKGIEDVSYKPRYVEEAVVSLLISVGVIDFAAAAAVAVEVELVIELYPHRHILNSQYKIRSFHAAIDPLRAIDPEVGDAKVSMTQHV